MIKTIYINISMANMMNNDSVEFQLYDWCEDNEIDNNDSDDSNSNNPGRYIIHSFGRTENGQSVYCKIKNYEPYFFILLPEYIQQKDINEIRLIGCYFLNDLKNHSSVKISNIYKTTLIKSDIRRYKKADGFTNNRLYYYIKLSFTNSDGMKKYKGYIENNTIYFATYISDRPLKLKTYESNILPMLRCFHNRNISGCSWVKTSNYILVENDNIKQSKCDIEIHTDWNNIVPIEKNKHAPFRICSFDIETYSIDGQFPRANRLGDCIIQIACTYTTIGDSEPYRQFICCLNETDPVPNSDTVVCKTEKELILAFADELNKHDCDIITGYNIFYFDEKYIYDRCELLDIDISDISKLKNYYCKFIEMKMTSSALGENILKFWNTPGRVHIDLMKDIQKTISLPSYKLDSVASKFIRGNIFKWQYDDKYIYLYSDTINDIHKEDYIHIECTKGFISDEIGHKYLIIDIDINSKILIISYNYELIEYLNNINTPDYKLEWSQAKDDITAKDIFKLYKQSSYDRFLIAKYCIKDCKLVSLLVNKLETIMKNIEMANVCYIPLSYLFTRGQGIKVFSLCLKEYRKQKYLFPVIKVNKLYKCTKCGREDKRITCETCKIKGIEIFSNDNKYEGAIVFDPVPAVEYEAVATKDYASLYPSSIIHKNMSHETLIIDKQYDNLNNVQYYNASFKDSKGDIQYRKFAKTSNQLGVIPSVLNNLLLHRKMLKQEMKKEKDIFKYKILDAKQYAIKITANSLYGQLGAITSPLCNKDIAACTTSTGREMLLLARKYDEELLPYIINTLKYYKSNDKIMNMIYENELEYCSNNITNQISSYINNISNILIQPVVRYGDTDSIFSCYKFRENSKLLTENNVSLLKTIIGFAKVLILPYIDIDKQDLFIETFDTYYEESKITSMILPKITINNINEYAKYKELHYLDITVSDINTAPSSNVIYIKNLLKYFVKEYIEEIYFPWLSTLVELVERNKTEYFDMKLYKWAEYHLTRTKLTNEKLTCMNLHENRKKYLTLPILTKLNKIFDSNIYKKQSEEVILDFTNYILYECKFSNELKIEYNTLSKINKIFFDKTLKDKWCNSYDKREVQKVLDSFTKNIVINAEDEYKIKNILLKYLINNITDKNTIIREFESIPDCYIDIVCFNNSFDIFVTNINKAKSKKKLDLLVEEYINKELKLSFDYEKDIHYNTVINFINDNLKKKDINGKSVYYYIQYRWIFNDSTYDNKNILIDIYEGGTSITDERSLQYTMEMGKISSDLIRKYLPKPHVCEYEKTFWPFAIVTKKKYVGNKYEDNINKYKRDFMGVVLKRRDNPPIVKEIYDGIIHRLIDLKNPQMAKDFTFQSIEDMFAGKYDIKYFLQSRNLKSKESYKNWESIAHVYLANKIQERDPGNTPQVGDRIEFAVIKVNNNTKSKLLQGDIIETPSYIKENNLKIDYMFYLTNQILNPSLQFLELVDPNIKHTFNNFIASKSTPKIKKCKQKYNYTNDILQLLEKMLVFLNRNN